MAPQSASPRAVATVKRTSQTPGKACGKATKPTGATSIATPCPVVATKSDAELVKDFRSDLQSIRSLVTCTICDQLLYEPWTLGCGHTYCYTCLCSWFLPNKRKKTCPDCRTLVRQTPAPAFLVKQIVEVFINRVELMPIDETIEQHKERKSSESSAVELDRASDLGLFKGCFDNQPLRRLHFNEEDRVYRCTRCSHEWVGGALCENCGLDFEGDEEEIDPEGFSDVDADLEFDYEVDLDTVSDEGDAELEDDIDDVPQGLDFFREQGSPLVPHVGHREPNIPSWVPARFRRGHRRGSISSNSDNSEDDEDEEGSMRDFIENDEGVYGDPDSYHSPSSVSRVSLSSEGPESVSGDNGDADESSDEGGAVSAGRRRGQAIRAGVRGTTSVVNVSDSTSTSEAGDLAEESRRLQDGWSPLEQEPDSDYGERQPFVTHSNSEDSDNDTTVGNQASEEEDDDRHGENRSSTPVWATSRSLGPRFRHGDEEQLVDDHSEADGYVSDVHERSLTDREGDVEMSVSPVSSRRNSAASGNADRRTRRSIEIIGPANTVHDLQGDSSDGTVQPANRRRRQPRYSRHSHSQAYDPRISMMFAQHQLDLQDVTARQSPYFEPGSRSRTSTSYRQPAARGPGPSSHPYPSPTVILTSVSTRPNRAQRQYSRRYFT